MHKTKVLITKLGLDGHDVGAKVISQALRDAGMEVVYLGKYQTPETIVRAAVQEDVDAIGLSILSGEQLTLLPKLMDLVRENGLDRLLVVVGGIFPRQDIPAIKQMGVDEVFVSSLVAPAVEYISRQARQKQKTRQVDTIAGALGGTNNLSSRRKRSG